MAGPKAHDSLGLSRSYTHLAKVIVVGSISLMLFCSLGSTCPNTTCGHILVAYPFSIINNGKVCSPPGYQLNCDTMNNLTISLASTAYSISDINYTKLIITLAIDFTHQKWPTMLNFQSNGTYSFPWLNSSSPPPSWPDPDLLLPPVLIVQVQYVYPDDQKQCTICLTDKRACSYSSSRQLYCAKADGPSQPTSAPKPPDCSTDRSCKSHSNHTALIAGLAVGGSTLMGAFLLVFFLFLKTRRRSANYEDPVVVDASPKEDRYPIQRRTYKGIPIFTYKELAIATNYFSEARLLGGGGFSSVYKGILSDGHEVAVKKLNQWNQQFETQFYNEVEILSKARHPHLVQMHGCCQEGREALLVYEFVPNGTVADHLHGNAEGFSWATRLRIATQTAQALVYLHENASLQILHRDIKATNILLDEHFDTKVADFGLSRLCPLEATHISTAPQGTPGYLDPDYYESYQLTDKSDVYSLGVLLMELISAKKAVDLSRDRKEINLASLAIAKIQCGALDEIIDPRLQTQSDPDVKEMVTRVAELAFCCLSSERDDRPCMREVAEKLQQILQQQQAQGSKDMRSKQKLSEARIGMNDEHLLVKNMDLISPTSVIETKWLRSTDSSNNSI